MEPLIREFSLELPGIDAMQVIREFLTVYSTDSERFPDLIARMEKKKLLKEGFLARVALLAAKPAPQNKLDENVIRHYTSSDEAAAFLSLLVEQGHDETSATFQTFVNKLVSEKKLKPGLLSWREREHPPFVEQPESPPRRKRGRPKRAKVEDTETKEW